MLSVLSPKVSDKVPIGTHSMIETLSIEKDRCIRIRISHYGFSFVMTLPKWGVVNLDERISIALLRADSLDARIAIDAAIRVKILGTAPSAYGRDAA